MNLDQKSVRATHAPSSSVQAHQPVHASVRPPVGEAIKPSHTGASAPSGESTLVNTAASNSADAGSGNHRPALTGTISEPKEFGALSPNEQQKLRTRLESCKRTITTNMSAWLAIAEALLEIRNLRLYRVDGYTEFGKYCREQLGIPKSTANRQIGEGEIYNHLASTGAKILPESDRQMRALLCLRKTEQEPEVWGKKVEQVWEKAVLNAKLTPSTITEKSIATARKQLGFDPPTKQPKQPESDLDKRWLKVESVLRNEREFWPSDRWHELCVRIAELLAEWNGSGKKRQSEFDAPAPKVIKVTKATATPASAFAEADPEPDMTSKNRSHVVGGPTPIKKTPPMAMKPTAASS